MDTSESQSGDDADRLSRLAFMNWEVSLIHGSGSNQPGAFYAAVTGEGEIIA